MKLIHVTDPHLVSPGKPLWDLDAAARLDACLEDIAKWHGDADFCVVSGDLTDKGEPDAYNWLKDRLDRFPLKTFLMLGNHDERDAFRAALPNHAVDEAGFVQQSHQTDAGTFLFLDTKKAGRVSEGELCATRRDWLERQLREAGTQPVYIFMHHPPCDIGVAYMDRIKLDDAETFGDLVTEAGNVKHIFFGHVHRPSYINWRGIPCTSLPGTNHQVPLVRESVGTAYSQEPPGYGIVTIGEDCIAVHFDACLNRSPVIGT